MAKRLKQTYSINKKEHDAAIAEVGEAEKLIKQRQKKIKLADKSEAGWLAVKEYETEVLASDSEDEKRIRKVQKAASQKRRLNSLKQEKARKTASGWSSNSSDTSCINDRTFFRGRPFPLLCIQGAGKYLHVACRYICVCLLRERQEKENYFPSYERSEEEGKYNFIGKPKIPQ